MFYKENPKIRLFVDMDGTLAEWKKLTLSFSESEEATPEMIQKKIYEILNEPEYYYRLQPHNQVIEAIREIVSNPEVEVFILSCVLPDGEQNTPQKDKDAWLDKFLPEIDKAHRIFVPDGENKTSFVPGRVRKTDFLLDDYTKNLTDWEVYGTGIKLLNNVNSSKNTWQGSRIAYNGNSHFMAQSLLTVMLQQKRVVDANPPKDWEEERE